MIKKKKKRRKKKDVINFQQKEEKSSSSTEEGSEDIRLHTKKKLYDQVVPVEERRSKEDKDALRLSENSSIQAPKEKEEL